MIPISKPLLDEAEIKNVTEVLKSGMLASGTWVNNFENAFAGYVGLKHAIDNKWNNSVRHCIKSPGYKKWR